MTSPHRRNSDGKDLIVLSINSNVSNDNVIKVKSNRTIKQKNNNIIIFILFDNEERTLVEIRKMLNAVSRRLWLLVQNRIRQFLYLFGRFILKPLKLKISTNLTKNRLCHIKIFF